MTVRFLVSGLFASAIFWMKNTVSFAGWSLLGLAAFAAWIEELRREPLEQADDGTGEVAPRWLGITLFFAAGLWTSANFHAGATSILKLLTCYALLKAFEAERGAWRKAIETSVKITGTAVAAFAVFRPARIMADPYHFASLPHSTLLSGFFGAACLLFLWDGFERVGHERAINWAGAGLLFLAQLSLGAMAPFVTTAACGTAILLRRGTVKGAHLAMVLTAALIALSLFKNPFVMIIRKMEDPYSSERLLIWKDSLRYFAHSPWFGTGIGTFRDHYPEFKTMEGIRLAPYAHNEPLNLACEIGILGLALLAWALWPVFRRLKDPAVWTGSGTGPWSWILAGIVLQSLFDFNLRYPPVLLLALAAIAFLERGERGNAARLARPKNSTGRAAIAAASLLGILVAIPGIADGIYLWRTRANSGTSRSDAALMAAEIDPFNAFYRYESGRMRDIAVALDLEPRNVWVRKSALRFYLQEWRRTGDPAALVEAESHADALKKLAPNLRVFDADFREISEEKARSGKF